VVIGACSSDDVDDARASSTSTTELPTFTGDADSAFCALLRDVDIDATINGEAGTPETVAAGFQRLVTVLGQVADAAPEEVAEDAAALADGMAALNDALAAVGYDFDVLAVSPDAAAITQAVNDPAFTIAGDRLQAYREQVCGL
jgi:hypothetical protein